MRYLAKLCLLCVLLMPCVVRGEDPGPDLFLGRWVLDAQASRYPGKTCPKQMIIEMTREERGVHYHSHTVPFSGEPFDVDYTAAYDGRPAMVTGSKGILLPVSLQRKGLTVVATYRNALQVAATSERTLSADVSTMTITTKSFDSLGTAVTNVGVYRRDPATPGR